VFSAAHETATKRSLTTPEEAKGNIDEQNENYARRVKAMEDDLALRHQFFAALSGVYVGEARSIVTNEVTHQVNITVVPSLPPYPNTGRVRTIEELEYELNNLYLNIESLDSHDTIAYGCVFQAVRPDMNRGTLQLVADMCVKTLSLQIAMSGRLSSLTSAEVASGVFSGEIENVEIMKGFSNSNVSGVRHSLNLKKQGR
jgi:hypothetical protein